MIVAGYAMDIYCDCQQCGNAGKLTKTQFVGQTWSDVARQARARGWKIGRDKMTAYAPNHTREEKEKP